MPVVTIRRTMIVAIDNLLYANRPILARRMMRRHAPACRWGLAIRRSVNQAAIGRGGISTNGGKFTRQKPRHVAHSCLGRSCRSSNSAPSQALAVAPELAFQLPLLSYPDAHQEEPELGAPVRPRKSRGILAIIAAFKAWREKRTHMAELSMMTDRELSDIGLTRSDLGRVFDSRLNMDLLRRGRAAD
jgi:uncharacterized protein YjiS (DUF1127 family)